MLPDDTTTETSSNSQAVVSLLPINTVTELIQWLEKSPTHRCPISPTMVVIGPEQPLADGWVDTLSTRFPGLQVIGPSCDNARLESSKSYAKERMKHYNIPTTSYQYFTKSETESAHKYLDENYSDTTSTKGLPVLKADGLAGGKGVVLPDTLVRHINHSTLS